MNLSHIIKKKNLYICELEKGNNIILLVKLNI